MLWLLLAGLIVASPPVVSANDDAMDLAPWRALGLDELTAGIDKTGALEGSDNLQLRDVAVALARAYRQSGVESDAARVIAILNAYARVVEHWPVISRRSGEAEALSEADFSQWDRGGFWAGEWIYLDLESVLALNEAWLAVKDSETLAALSADDARALRKSLADNLFGFLVDANLQFYSDPDDAEISVFPYTNMDPFRLKAMAILGKEWNPAWVHIAHHALQEYPRLGFFRDGIWHEGSFSYHRQVQRQLGWLADNLRGYSDPPGYSFVSYTSRFGRTVPGTPGRFDTLDPLAGVSGFYDRISDALASLVYPDGSIVAVHDTHFDQDHEVTTPVTHSRCLYGMRHCVLHRKDGDRHQVTHLHYGGSDGHEQSDALNITFWANGYELASEGDYKRHATEAFTASIWAHNTVAVNGENQDGRWDQQEKLAEREMIPGHGWLAWRRRGYGNTNNQGDLLYSDLDSSRIQVISAEAPRAYDDEVNLGIYERTLISLPGARDGFAYIVDVFRVAGGKRHDWILHGDLSREQTLSVDDIEFAKKRRKRGELRATLAARADAPWRSTFAGDEPGSRLLTRHLNPVRAMVLKASGPAQRRDGDAPYLVDSRRATSTVFVKLHSLGSEDPVASASLRQSAHDATDPVVVEVVLKSGRRDLVALQTPQHRQALLLKPRADVQLKTDALVTVLSSGGPAPYLYALGGVARLGDDDCLTEAAAGSMQTARVIEISDAEENGHNRITVEAQSDLATAGFPLHIRLPNGVVESYDVTAVNAEKPQRLELSDTPGLRYNPKTRETRQTYYPQRVYDGDLFAFQHRASSVDLATCLNQN